MTGPLRLFSEPTREWFASTFDGPTPAQVDGWAAIAGGGHTLIHAPTGSGKTLAAFMWAALGCRPAVRQRTLVPGGRPDEPGHSH